jgi:hypothetical protein
MAAPRMYRFALTVRVEEGHEAYGDPEWVADAAAGALSNIYELRCIWHELEESDEDTDLLA